MEQAIISLVGFGLALMIYLDRVHRADRRADRTDMRADMRAGFAQVDERFAQMDKRFVKLEKKLEKKIEDSASRTDARINELNHAVIQLAQSVGRVEGRSEVLTAVE